MFQIQRVKYPSVLFRTFQTAHSTDVSVLTEEGAELPMCAGTDFNVSRTDAPMNLNEKEH